MRANNAHIIRVKKRVSSHQGGHGGSWKIAYADFMTAMMAFFLVMWLISISSPQELTQIAEYFRTPLKTAINPGAKSGDATNPIPGGGKDIIFRDGDVLPEPNNEIQGHANFQFEKLKRSLEQATLKDPRLNELKPHLLIDMIDEGLRIQIVDSANRPMFMVGSAHVESYMRDILRALAPLLNDVPNKISISGHTDDLPYANGANYNNWELSADRANASRRELIAGGLTQDKILRVVGMASSIHLDKSNGLAPINRRISIIVLNESETEQILHEYDGATTLSEVLHKSSSRPEPSSIGNAENATNEDAHSSSISTPTPSN
ncbi:flagellar motor protein MotB [Providencia stuartii]|uniref:flagellar motor protein MotB n=1 Tax=Providencia stuartii TaxID=588 RepID=UPI001FF1064B|nr:flagellar motor protein MotB [Providencia stuartii]ELZ5938990.1 flagellar motor protein MotB [Providencia stuartii]MCK1142766.1 flagellar motor protein MotB [Providencia stuartii]